MADSNKSYPAIAPKNWFALRREFLRTVPNRVTLSYVASVLNIKEDSARANVVGPMRIVGLIDDSGKPTDLAYRWRDDTQYASVCQEILDQIYDDELRALAPDASTPIERVSRWFISKRGLGESAAGKNANFYFLLLKADLQEASEATTNSTGSSRSKTANSNSRSKGKPDNTKSANRDNEQTRVGMTQVPEQPDLPVVQTSHEQNSVSLHFDFQIHISPEASTEQIDQIFASMAKHLNLARS
ncbi:MAG: DUF5343 domain-containing protein [Chloroflexota bacterium]|nr:DUF5343 domain-containing protein [Chloroflexota bacterium]